MSGITINEEEGTAVLQVDMRFYGYLTVLVTAAEFTEHVWVQLDQGAEGYLTVRLASKGDGINLGDVSREFFNYMLALMGESLDVMSKQQE